MRLLWARVGVPYSPATGLPIESQTVSPDGRPRAGAARGHAALSAGADRARPQGRVPQGARRAARRRASSASRSTARSTRSTTRRRSTRSSSTTSRWWSTAWWCAPDIATRLADSLETALELADGLAIVEFADERRRTASRAAGIARSRRSSPARSPASPSPRSSRGCSRSTTRPAPARPATASAPSMTFDPDLVVPDTATSLRQGAIAPWARSTIALLRADAGRAGPPLQVRGRRRRGRSCPKKAHDAILYGSGEERGDHRLRRRPARLRDQEAVRGRDRQPRAPLARDRERLGARGARHATSPPPRATPAAAIA